jgi:hypothetical protein
MKLASGPTSPILTLGLLAANVANAEGPEQSTMLETAQTCAVALKTDRVALADATRADDVPQNEIPYRKDASGDIYGYFFLTDPAAGETRSLTETSNSAAVVTAETYYVLTQFEDGATLLEISKNQADGDKTLWMETSTRKNAASVDKFLIEPNGHFSAHTSLQNTYAPDRATVSSQSKTEAYDGRGNPAYSPDTSINKGERANSGPLMIWPPKEDKTSDGYAPEIYHPELLEAAQANFTKELGKFTQDCQAERALIQSQLPKESK